jgi:hypothetical protein
MMTSCWNGVFNNYVISLLLNNIKIIYLNIIINQAGGAAIFFIK